MNFIAAMSGMTLSQFLFFLTLVVTILSCWLAPRWITYTGAIIVAGLAYCLNYVEALGLLYLLIIAVVTYQYDRIPLLLKGILGIALGIFVMAIYLHYMPGFHNFIILDHIRLSATSSPYSSYVNVDKVMVGLTLLLNYRPLNRTFNDWVRSVRILPIPLFYVCALLLGTAFAMHYIKIDIKMPDILWWWIPTNLLFVCMTEEVFYRGFIQNQLTKALAPYKGGQWLAIGVAAFIFGLSHYKGGVSYIILSTLAGMGYGYVFKRSNRLESSILLHFLVNLIHILFFSYPSLARG